MSKSNKQEFDQDDIEHMVDLLLETSMSLTDIAKELGWNLNFLNKKINQLGLSWAKERHRKMSRGQAALTAIMQKLLPNEKIVNEHYLGERLKLDIYCPKYKIGAEYHGRQHFYYTSRFFESKEDFERALERDERKIELCKEQGIALIIFRYNDKLTEEAVYERMLEAIKNSSELVAKTSNNAKKSLKDNEYYLKSKKRYNELRRTRYKELKKKNDKRRR
jgi:hypothetical protein